MVRFASLPELEVPRARLTGSLAFEQNKMLAASTSLPALRRQPPSRLHAVEEASPPHRSGVSKSVMGKMLGELLSYAEEEMRVRGIRRDARHSEARFAIWREALALFAQQLPTSQAFLSRVMAEFDAAIAALATEVRSAEEKISAAWLAQQQADERIAAAKSEAEKQVKSVLARHDAEQAALASAKEAHSRSMLSSEVARAISELAEPQRLECLGQAVDRLPIARRRYLLLRWLRRLAPAERSTILTHALQPGRRGESAAGADAHMAPAEAESDALVDPRTAREDEETSSAIESLLDVMPERLRLRLGVASLRSLSSKSRDEALSEVIPPAADPFGIAGGGSEASHMSAREAELAKQLAAQQEAAEASRLQVIALKRQLAQIKLKVHMSEAAAQRAAQSDLNAACAASARDAAHACQALGEALQQRSWG